MPFYDFICDKCGKEETAFFRMQEVHAFTCKICNLPMRKNYQKMVPLYQDVPVDSVDYDLTGEPIVYHSRGQLKRIAKEHGFTVNFGKSHVNHGETI